jgi:hypothetical protein
MEKKSNAAHSFFYLALKESKKKFQVTSMANSTKKVTWET